MRALQNAHQRAFVRTAGVTRAPRRKPDKRAGSATTAQQTRQVRALQNAHRQTFTRTAGATRAPRRKPDKRAGSATTAQQTQQVRALQNVHLRGKPRTYGPSRAPPGQPARRRSFPRTAQETHQACALQDAHQRAFVRTAGASRAPTGLRVRGKTTDANASPPITGTAAARNRSPTRGSTGTESRVQPSATGGLGCRLCASLNTSKNRGTHRMSQVELQGHLIPQADERGDTTDAFVGVECAFT